MQAHVMRGAGAAAGEAADNRLSRRGLRLIRSALHKNNPKIFSSQAKSAARGAAHVHGESMPQRKAPAMRPNPMPFWGGAWTCLASRASLRPMGGNIGCNRGGEEYPR